MSSQNDLQLEIITYIKKYITTNKLAEGDKIPSANTIARQFQTNRSTVRGALALLSAQGYLYSEQGRGFFVSKKNRPIVFHHENGMGFSEILGGKRNYESTIIKYSKITAGSTLSKYLKIDENDMVHSLKVLRKVDGIPLAICQSFLPEKRLPDFASHLENFSSVNKILMDDYNFSHPQCTKVTIEACNPTPEDVFLLDISMQIPILKQSEQFCADGAPIEFFVVRARGDRFYFFMAFQDEYNSKQ